MVAERVATREIVWLGQVAAQARQLVGGKVAPLSRLAARYRVPPGFCLTTLAFEQWEADADGECLPAALEREIAAAYLALAERCGAEEPAVAVRSSAVDEDGAAASFAGQLDTYLNVVGAAAVCEAVARCRSSAHSSRVADYRRRHGLPANGARLAVLVQQLVVADVSAVVFSANPLTGSRAEVVINASWGLGESVVGGSVTPDTYVVRSEDWTVAERLVAEKRRMSVAVAGGTREVAVPRLLWTQPALRDEQAAEMARLAGDLERTMGWPVDVECAYRDDVLYLLQCRPITTLGATAEPGRR
ncbi:MAG: PEP/pyruvate-binding domain-containing protein [Chloroflexota bacterium]|nr:PEP/pyruvate-binding domain-containing protein [Chloroflexota bacterium]